MRRDHGGDPRARIDASVNVNPMGPPRSLDAVFRRARELAARYPEVDALSAREAWADRLGVSVESLLVGNGASELISLTVRAVAPRRVIVFDPCYSEYVAAARAAGVPSVSVPLVLSRDEWKTPCDELLAWEGGEKLCEGDLVIVGQPNNPTGHFVEPESLLAFAARGAHVLVDESFLALSSEPAHSLLSHVGDRISVVASLTKTFCVPGLRLGLLAAAQPLVARISRMRDPWSVNGIAAEAAVELAAQDEYLARSRALLCTERARMSAAVAALPGVRVTQGVAPWVLAELPAQRTAARLCADLLARGIAVRDASTFPGLSARWIRTGIRSPAENGAIISALMEVW